MAVERLPSVTTPPAQQPSRDVRSLQKAFFEAALTKVQAAQPNLPEPHVTPLQTTAAPRPAPDAGTKIPRPGSIIDIKV